MFGAGLLASGLTVSEAAMALVFGNLLLLGPLVLNGHAGVAYGIPFPVLLRSSFGHAGAQIPVALRGIVGICWSSFNLWIGADAIYSFVRGVMPQAAHSPAALCGLNVVQLLCFVGFLLLHVMAGLAGVDRLKPFLRYTSVVQGVGLLGKSSVEHFA